MVVLGYAGLHASELRIRAKLILKINYTDKGRHNYKNGFTSLIKLYWYKSGQINTVIFYNIYNRLGL